MLMTVPPCTRPQGAGVKGAADIISLEEALRRLDTALAGLRLPVCCVTTRLAQGRVLAETEVSRSDLPPFDKSAVDGYAIPSGGREDRYDVVDTVAAGDVRCAPLTAGTAVKVMTGAPVPPGTDRVVMLEDTEQAGRTVLIRQRRGGTNICRRGEDVCVGDPVLAAGTTLTPLDVANLISCGIAEVRVARRPRVAVISTGKEIVDAVEDLGPGKIMNTNGPLLAGLADRYGMEIVREDTYPDELASLRSGVEAALDQADVVVLSGGVSTGDFDYVPRALQDLDFEIHFSRVAVKPGKPVTFATRGEKVAIGLPGNPVSVYLTFHLFALRALVRLTGAEPPARQLRQRLGEAFQRRGAERQEFVPARLTAEGTVVRVESNGSAHLMALTQADGFFVVPAGVTRVAPGEPVSFLPLMGRWS